MDTKKIIIVPKITVFDYTRNKLNLSGSEIINKWKEDGMSERDIGAVMQAHDNHHNSLGLLKKLFTEDQFVARDHLNREMATRADIVISLGGDDHFQYVSHFLDNTPIMGVNSDPTISDGNILQFTASDVEKTLPNIINNSLNIEEWTRLSAKIHQGKNIFDCVLASAQYTILTEDPEEMVRYRLDLNGMSEKQRGSGLIIATGTGSTGWYRGASKYASHTKYQFSKQEKIAKLILREPFEKGELPSSKVTAYSLYNSTIKDSEELIVTYLSHGEGRLSSDTLVKYSLTRGNKINIKISNKPLRVLVKKRINRFQL